MHTGSLTIGCTALLLLVSMTIGPRAAGQASNRQTAPSQQSIVAESVETTPWYDAEQQRLTPIPVHVRQDDSIHRNSRWLPRPDKVTQATPSQTSSGGAGGNAGGLFGSSLTMGHLFGWGLLLAIVLAVVGCIVYAVSRAELGLTDRKSQSAAGAAAAGLPDAQTLERIKHLPPELRRTDVNLRSECERLMGEGLYEQAIILLLGHQLLLLDRGGLVRLSRGKTNGRYVRETRVNDDQCGRWLRQTADAFEQSYFGRHEIPAEAFVELWRQNERLEATVQSKEET